MFKFIYHIPKLLVHSNKQKPEEYTSLEFAEGTNETSVMEDCDSSPWFRSCV